MTARRRENKIKSGAARSLAGTLFTAVSVLLWIGGGALSAEAQYNSPVGKEANASIPSKESFDESYDEARWSAGPFRVQPWIGLRDASFVTIQTVNDDGSIDESDDFTATAGAGFRAYARNSPKLVLAIHALPEYTWWQDNDDKSGVNGRYGAGLFGFFNRLKLEASVRRTERQDIFSTEVQQLTTVEEDLARVGFEVEVARGVDVWARARSKEYGNNEDDLAIFRVLNRSEDDVAIGARLRSRQGYRLGLGFKDLSADFDPGSRNLSNEGTAVMLELGFESGRFGLTGDLEKVELEPVEGSILEELDEVVGRIELSWEASRRVEMLLFGHRDLTYSVSSTQSHVVSQRTGFTTRLKGSRGYVDFTYATGEDQYEALGDVANRTDDVTELRAALRLPVGNLFSVTFYGTSLDYDSNIEGLDREFSTYGVAVDLGRLARRLSLGEAEGVW